MSYELFWMSGSPFAWRTLLGFAVKGVDYESRRLNASEGEHKEAWFLEINPRGQVPALKDGDTMVTESMAILAYLEAKHPEPRLFGATPKETALIWQLACEIDNYLWPKMREMLFPILFGSLDGKEDGVKEAAKEVHGELSRFEADAGASEYLAGAAVSAADLALFPLLQIMVRAAGKEHAKPLDLGFLPFDDHYPHLAAWVKRIEALPGYDVTYPPHW